MNVKLKFINRTMIVMLALVMSVATLYSGSVLSHAAVTVNCSNFDNLQLTKGEAIGNAGIEINCIFSDGSLPKWSRYSTKQVKLVRIEDNFEVETGDLLDGMKIKKEIKEIGFDYTCKYYLQGTPEKAGEYAIKVKALHSQLGEQDGTFKFTVKDKPVVPKEYKITVNNVEGAKITTDPDKKAAKGTTVKVNVEVTDPTKELESILVNDKAITGNSFDMPEEDVTVTAKLKNKPVVPNNPQGPGTSNPPTVAPQKPEKPENPQQNDTDNNSIAKYVKELKLSVDVKKLKKGHKITLKVINGNLEEFKNMGYEFKVQFFKANNKTGKYKPVVKTSKKSIVIKKLLLKGNTYNYKARILAYDKLGKLVAKTKLVQCSSSNYKVK